MTKKKVRAVEMRLQAEKSLIECGHLTLSELAYETSQRCRFQVGREQLACILTGIVTGKRHR